MTGGQDQPVHPHSIVKEFSQPHLQSNWRLYDLLAEVTLHRCTGRSRPYLFAYESSRLQPVYRIYPKYSDI